MKKSLLLFLFCCCLQMFATAQKKNRHPRHPHKKHIVKTVKKRAPPKSTIDNKTQSELLFAQKQYATAIPMYTATIALYPNIAELYKHRGFCYYKQCLYEIACNDYAKAIALSPNDYEGYRMKADAQFQLKQFDLAISNYTHSINIQPYDATSYKNRGDVYAANKIYTLAIADYNKALAINNCYGSAYASRGYVYLQQKKYTTAEADFTVALALNPFNNHVIALLERTRKAARDSFFFNTISLFLLSGILFGLLGLGTLCITICKLVKQRKPITTGTIKYKQIGTENISATGSITNIPDTIRVVYVYRTKGINTILAFLTIALCFVISAATFYVHFFLHVQ